MHWGKLPNSSPGSEVVPGRQMKTKKHADVSQVAHGEAGDARHMENLLLGEVEGSKGTKWLSEVVGCRDVPRPNIPRTGKIKNAYLR